VDRRTYLDSLTCVELFSYVYDHEENSKFINAARDFEHVGNELLSRHHLEIWFETAATQLTNKMKASNSASAATASQRRCSLTVVYDSLTRSYLQMLALLL
jgi:hypothetical protein